MRKLLFVFVASSLVLAGGNAFAQEAGAEEAGEMEATGTADSGLQVGVAGILNMSNVSAEEEMQTEPSSKLGFGGGLRVIYSFTDMFGVQPEVLFNQRGITFESDAGDISTTLNYLQVPVLARAHMDVGSGITPKFLLGPTFGYFLGGSTSSDIEGFEGDFDDENFASFEIGAAVGAGVDYDLGAGSLSFDLRYNYGLTDTNDYPEDTPDDAKNKTVNTAFDILLGYNYKF